MTLQERIDYFDRQFGFRAHPEDFDFYLSPERIAYKNEALRQQDRKLYVGYLADNFPDEMEQELKSFDELSNRLKQLSKEEAEQLFRDKGINLLQSDLSYKDPDAIYKLLKVADEDLNWHLEGSEEDLVNGKVRPNTVLQLHPRIWVLT